MVGLCSGGIAGYRYRYRYRLQNSVGIKGPCDWGWSCCCRMDDPALLSLLPTHRLGAMALQRGAQVVNDYA
jgi:hypothetical protein